MLFVPLAFAHHHVNGPGATVVLLGRSKPDTIQALAEWSLGNRAATVTMVPLSYLLSRSQL